MEALSINTFWKENFGLLPIHLNPSMKEEKFLMLNGGTSDFCLDTETKSKINEQQYFESAWSTNTKNYLRIEKDLLTIYNCFEKKKEEIKIETVLNSKKKFYQYLVSKSFKTSIDIVPFIIDIFRQLRNVTRESVNPREAINLLNLLLVSLEDDFYIANYENWGISLEKIPEDFDYFVELIRNGMNSLKPELDLLLRHTSGVLYQEAHREVLYFDPQRDLFGGISSKLVTKSQNYSSIHYTPQYIARTIVENSINKFDFTKSSIKILDPSCGSGEFLIEALKQIKEKLYDGEIFIYGYDISQSAIDSAKFILDYENKTQWDNKLNINLTLVDDSLAFAWDKDFDLIFMNPPFISWELLKNKSSRELVLETLNDVSIKGKPNQASAFFYKATNSLSNDGVLGCILPSSIFLAESYSKLRIKIKEKIDLNLIGKLGNFVFEDALTDVGMFVGTKSHKGHLPQVIWTRNEKGIVNEALREFRKANYNNIQTVNNKDYDIFTAPTFPLLNNTWQIISYDQIEFLKMIGIYLSTGKLSKVSDIFSVKQGIRTGHNNLFLIDEYNYKRIPENERHLFRKSINNQSIKNGVLKVNNYVWYPYNNNGPLFSSEEEILEAAPYSYNKLLNEKEKLLQRPRINLNNWWGLSEHRAWLRQEEPRLYSTEFGKSDSFAFDNIGDFVVERGHGWIPKRTFVIDDYYFYLSVFSSSIFDELLKMYSKPILSGYYLGQSHVKEIPIPNIFTINKKSSAYLDLVKLGKDLSGGIHLAKYAIDDILKKIYYPSLKND